MKLDISEPTQRVWSLQMAELPFTDGNQKPAHHCFLLLVEECPGGYSQILDELHFVPTKRRIESDDITQQANQTAIRPDTEFLGAVAYTKSSRNLENLTTISYERGAPRNILNIWNAAFCAALKINALERKFEVGDCRAGVQAVIESLGYEFRTFPELQTRPGLTVNLFSKIGSHLPHPILDDLSLINEFHILHQRLNGVRNPIASKKHTIG